MNKRLKDRFLQIDKVVEEAKQQAYDDMEKIIGEDEELTVVGRKYGTEDGKVKEMIGDGEREWKEPRNELRAEQRKKLNELKRI